MRKSLQHCRRWPNGGHLNEPVIGVAKAGWNLDQLKAGARDSVAKHGGLDAASFEKLCGLLRHVDGDYKDSATFQSIREQLGSAQRPASRAAPISWLMLQTEILK
jgi:glucose-6-phosphate 1-dehydrogenase